MQICERPMEPVGGLRGSQPGYPAGLIDSSGIKKANSKGD